MKIRKGFVSNSSSSSFVIGYTGEIEVITYGDKYNLPELIKIKKMCLDQKIDYPELIKDIEAESGGLIESLSPSSIYSEKAERVRLDDCIIEEFDEEITINVSKIPKNVKTIVFKYEDY